MDGSDVRQRIGKVLFQYRYAVLILLAGVFLMLIPGADEDLKKTADVSEATVQEAEPDFETRLSQVLCQIEGAGKVVVFLSQAAGEQTLYQTDETKTGDDLRQETILITGSDRSQSGLIRQVNPPVYLGAIVLCQGADNAAIRLSITQAVANATGLGANQISVLKMK